MNRVEVGSLVGDTCITLEQGEPVYEAVRSMLSSGEAVVLDFSGVAVCASPFLNAAVGRLLKDFTPDVLDAHLKVEKLTPVGYELLRRVLENSNRYYRDPQSRKALEEILNEENAPSEVRADDVSDKR